MAKKLKNSLYFLMCTMFTQCFDAHVKSDFEHSNRQLYAGTYILEIAYQTDQNKVKKLINDTFKEEFKENPEELKKFDTLMKDNLTPSDIKTAIDKKNTAQKDQSKKNKKELFNEEMRLRKIIVSIIELIRKDDSLIKEFNTFMSNSTKLAAISKNYGDEIKEEKKATKFSELMECFNKEAVNHRISSHSLDKRDD